MKKVIMSYFLASLFWAWGAHAEHPIFACLREPNYRCLKREMRLNQHWDRLKNWEGDTVLSVAIKMKDDKAVRYLIAAGAKANKDTILLAMYYFFDVHPDFLEEKKSFRSTHQTKLIIDLLLYATQEHNSERNLYKLSSVLDLFSSPEDVAMIMEYLWSKKLLKKRHINILLRYYKNLFLQDNFLSHRQITTIIASLLNLRCEHNLLLLIADNYKLYIRAQEAIIPHYAPVNQRDLPAIAHDFAQGIIQNSQQLMLAIPASVWVQYALLNIDNSAIDNFVNYINKLSKYIELSILYYRETDEIERKYIFWHRIVDMLIDEGDLMGAFPIAMSLGATAIQKNLSDKILLENNLIKFQDNFGNYRSIINQLRNDNKFHTLAMCVHAHDLEAIKELGLFKSSNGRLINWNSIRLLTNFRRQLNKSHRSIKTRNYSSSDAMSQFLANLPQSREELPDFKLDNWGKMKGLKRSNTVSLSLRSVFLTEFPRAASVFEKSPRSRQSQ